MLESWGLAVEVGAHALDEWGYMAGRDEDRLADLNDAFADPGVRAIVATRGGAGAYRIADRIDFDAVRADPNRHVGIGQIDRHLTHLIRSGAMDGVAAIALGSFEGFRGYTDRGWTVTDVLRDRLGALGVPVLGGLGLGHHVLGPDGNPDQFAATLGARADLDTERGTLTVGPCVR